MRWLRTGAGYDDSIEDCILVFKLISVRLDVSRERFSMCQSDPRPSLMTKATIYHRVLDM